MASIKHNKKLQQSLRLIRELEEGIKAPWLASCSTQPIYKSLSSKIISITKQHQTMAIQNKVSNTTIPMVQELQLKDLRHAKTVIILDMLFIAKLSRIVT